MSDSNFATGAVRSSDANELDFISISPIAMFALAKTCQEGATKYGAHNYELGMDTFDLINHVQRHLQLWLAGDRSEPHLPHAAWGMMAAIHMDTLHPELSEHRRRGPGCTVTPEMRKYLEDQKPILAEKRKAGLFAKIGEWTVAGIAAVKQVLDARTPLVVPVLVVDTEPRAESLHPMDLAKWHDDRRLQEQLRQAFKDGGIGDEEIVDGYIPFPSSVLASDFDPFAENSFEREPMPKPEIEFPVDLDDDDEEWDEPTPVKVPADKPSPPQGLSASADDTVIDLDKHPVFIPKVSACEPPQDMDCDSVTIGVLSNSRLKQQQRSGVRKVLEAIGLAPKQETYYF